MTSENVIALAKEKLGKEITEQEAQDYLSGKIAIPDEALDLISGGSGCNKDAFCSRCRLFTRYERKEQPGTYYCMNCGCIVP